MNPILFLISKQDFEVFKTSGTFEPASFQEEGFVHCSFKEQVRAVATKHYKDRQDIMLLELNEARVSAWLNVEDLKAKGEVFPHVYRVLAWQDVFRVHVFSCSNEGEFELPDSLKS